jgi:hypothetical protein
MSIELEPNSTESTASAPGRRQSRKIFVLLAAVIVLMLAAWALLLIENRGESVTWLTPAQMAQAKQTGPLTRLKYRLAWIINPLKRLIRGHREPQLLLEAHIWEIPGSNATQMELGQPISTNNNGMKAWLLSPARTDSLQKRFKSMSGAHAISSPRVTTADGVPSIMMVGNTLPGAGATTLFEGLTVDLAPHISGDTVKMLIGVTDTETNAGSPALSLITNLDVACRASIRDSDALIIDGGGAGEKHYWLTLKPVMIDATGKLIKR